MAIRVAIATALLTALLHPAGNAQDVPSLEGEREAKVVKYREALHGFRTKVNEVAERRFARLQNFAESQQTISNDIAQLEQLLEQKDQVGVKKVKEAYQTSKTHWRTLIDSAKLIYSKIMDPEDIGVLPPPPAGWGSFPEETQKLLVDLRAAAQKDAERFQEEQRRMVVERLDGFFWHWTRPLECVPSCWM